MHFDSGNPDLLLLSAPATAALLLLRVSPPALCRQQPASGNALALHFDSGNPDLLRNSWQQAVYIAAGSDPFALVDASVAAAAAIAGGARPRWEKQVPDICSSLGWCTWDAFYHDVSGLGLQQGLEGFRAADPARVPRWLIIDDGWQRTGLDNAARQQQQVLHSKPPPQQQQQQQAGSGPHSHPLPDSSLAGKDNSSSSSSSSSSSYRSSAWLLRGVRRVLQGCQRLVLSGVGAVAERLNWWPLLLSGLRTPLLCGVLTRCLKAFNVATSEHSKRLLSPEFNAKFRPLLLSGLRTPLLCGVLTRCLKAFNVATSEHSKRLLSPEFNAKFSNLTVGPTLDTSSTASAADVAGVIAAVKQRYNLKHVYAWHAILGYWSGVSPLATPAAAAAAASAASSAAAAAAESSAEADAEAAAKELAAAAAGIAAGDRVVSSSSSSSGMASSIVLPRVSDAMTDLEPPCNWSQLVLAGVGLPHDPASFYQQLHSYLASLGIDGVKVDVQNQLELVGSAAGQPGGQALAAAWHAALEASAGRHFPGNQLINCMCHNTNNLYRMAATNLARVSDDFYPRLPASHAPHVAVCAFNSLFMGVIVTPDWDMFHSRHPRALLHATARMISGGPVYVSDKPGAHDTVLLARLALPGGLLLQPLLPGRPTRDCLFVDPCRDGVSVLKVWSRNCCNGVVAAFNLQGSCWSRSKLKFVTHDSSPAALSTLIAPADVEGLLHCLPHNCSSSSSICNSGPAGQPAEPTAAAAAAGCVLHHSGEFVLYLDSSKALTVIEDDGIALGRQGQGEDAEGLSVQLAAAGSDVVTVAPLLELKGSSSSSSSSGSSDVKFAVIGLTNMLNPGGAVKSVSVDSSSSSSSSSREAGSDGGSSQHSSGSWVVADAAADSTAAAAAGDGNGSTEAAAAAAAPAAAAAGCSAAVRVSFVGCGQLLLHASCRPAAVLLDGQPAQFEYNSSSSSSSSSSLVVDVPEPATSGSSAQQEEAAGMQNELTIRFA
eukprot:jgi/Sobl393_1/9775/SZX78134.1